MKYVKPHDQLVRQLEERIAYLEETNRWHVFALDLLTSVTDIHGCRQEHQTAEAILQTTAQHLRRLDRFEAMGFLLAQEEDGSFRLAACEPAGTQPELQREIDQQIENGTFAWALNQNSAVIVRARRPNHSLILHVIATRARIRGMFVALVPGHYPSLANTVLDMLSIVLNNSANALESTSLYHLIRQQNQTLGQLVSKRTLQLAYQAGHDALTGLPNRLMFLKYLDQALEAAAAQGEQVALLLIDLDQFKRFNDTLGHALGDQLLQQVAQRLGALLPETLQPLLPDSKVELCRLGGDEFILLLPKLAQGDDAVRLIRRIIETVARPFALNGHEVFLSLSIGVAISPADGREGEVLLRNAETAMYHAKRHGRNNYQYYSSEMNSRALERLILENQLRHALTRKEFLLHYQPQVDLATGRVTGVEALLRWQQPEIGLVSPLQFIPLAEETGLILPIGEWVLYAACADMARLHREGFAGLQLAVNLSPLQFRQHTLKDQIGDILRETGLDPLCLELELTESALMDDMKLALELLHDLRSLGIRISIDDFGTGYSSLCYLKTFPLDSLKIDQTFVHDMLIDNQNETIVATMISLAHSLGLKVVAEGVEQPEQLQRLHRSGCDQIQGFLFSRPLPLHELIELLRSGRCLPLPAVP